MAHQPDDAVVTYYYREKTAPCFLWTLALAPCLMPTVWYVHVASSILRLLVDDQ